MNKQKGLAPLLLIILIAVVIAVGGYLIYQKQNKPIVTPQPVASSVATSSAETANWKTYTNYQLGISFSYPADWQVNEQLTKQLYYDGEIQLFSKSKSDTKIAIFYVNNAQQLSLQELDKKLATYTDASGSISPMFSSSDNKVVTFAGVSGYLQDKYFCEPAYCRRYVLPLKNKVVDIIIFSNQLQTQDQILSTFRFD
ncbi:MAG: PsbP-related protein [Candidatus Daviesbacteria bacterium]|nr:PsbP-related protein [Candidatus Daviesbacteria bacterium]